MNSSRCRSHSFALGSLLGSHFLSCTLTALNQHSVSEHLALLTLHYFFLYRCLLVFSALAFFWSVRSVHTLCRVVHTLLSYFIPSAMQHNKQMRKLRLRRFSNLPDVVQPLLGTLQKPEISSPALGCL